jgi:tetratricopeptide (TPR) repeat protein
MARLSHPNVAAVYDVGTYRGRVWVAMEFVDGVTLTEWLRDNRGDRAAVIAAFVAAGRGLAAAHEEKIVHRDFKPDNVMVDVTGRPRVLDFGLARTATDRDRRDADDGETSLTRTGSVFGTPKYMSPEQHEAKSVGPASDQFSFCVALHEALYGELPFAGDTVAELADNVTSGHLREPSRGGDVPAWLRRHLVRGLSVDPDARFEDVSSLLRQLERDPRARARRIAVAVTAIAVVAAVGGFVSYKLAKDRDEVCATAGEQLVGVWDDGRRDAVEAAFAELDAKQGPAQFRRAATLLDRYADSWVSMHTDACRATHVRGEQSAALLDLRMSCLDRRRDELRATVELFAEADASTMKRAVEVANALTSLDACADAEALAEVVPPPEDPEVRDLVADVGRRISEVDVLRRAGKYDAVDAPVASALARAREIGYDPLLADALYHVALLYRDRAKGDDAQELLRECTLVAARAKDDLTAARCWSALVGIVGLQLGKTGEAVEIANMAEAAIARAGSAPELVVTLEYYMSQALHSTGEVDEAMRRIEHAREVLENQPRADGEPPPLRLADVVYEMARQHAIGGEFEKATTLLDTSVAVWGEYYGPDHPELAYGYGMKGSLLSDLGRPAEAIEPLQHAVRIQELSLGADHPSLAFTIAALSNAQLGAGHPEAARISAERAVAIDDKAYGRDDPRSAMNIVALANTLERLGDTDTARAHLDHVVGVLDALKHREDPLPVALLMRAHLIFKTDGAKAALVEYERVLELAPANPKVVGALLGKGRCLISMDEPVLAIAALEAALATKGGQPRDYTAARLFLGLTLWQSQRDQKRAVELVEAAHAQLVSTGADEELVRQAEEFLQARASSSPK